MYMSTFKKYFMNLAIVFCSVSLFFSCGTNTGNDDKQKSQTPTPTIEKEIENTTTQTSAVLVTPEKDIVVKKNTEEITPSKTASSSTKIDKTELEDVTPEEIEFTVEEEIQETIPSTTIPSTPKKEGIKANTPAPVSSSNVAGVSHTAWNALLKKYVDSKGNVDYKSFKNDEKALQTYLDMLAVNEPSSSTPKKEKLAYYINLYNAATVKLILNNYPTKSIKSIKSPWGKKWVKVGNQVLSLGNIEHKILRKMNEPRIHFAINCASYSCPKLINSAFTASKMEAQLEQATKDFVNDITRNQFTDSKAKLSEIFKWYKGDFTDNGTVLEYIAKYANKTINTKSKVRYLDYDWSLNEKK